MLCNSFFYLFLTVSIIIVLLLSLSLLVLYLFLDEFLSTIFSIECFTKVGELYSNHQVQNKEGTEENRGDEEEIVGIGAHGLSNNVHHGWPTLKRNHLEDIHDREKNVVEAERVEDRVLVRHAHACYSFWLSIVAVLLYHAEYLFFVWADEMWNMFYSVVGNCLEASVLEVSAKQLGCDGSKHDQHEAKQHHNIKHDRHRVQDRWYQTAHSGHGIDGTQGSQNTDDSNGGDVVLIHEVWHPSQYNHEEIKL